MTYTRAAVTLGDMEPPTPQELRDARTVEIAFSLVIGAVIAAVLSISVLLAGWLLGLSGPAWESARNVALIVAVAAGVAASVWVLVRARRRGL